MTDKCRLEDGLRALEAIWQRGRNRSYAPIFMGQSVYISRARSTQSSIFHRVTDGDGIGCIYISVV